MKKTMTVTEFETPKSRFESTLKMTVFHVGVDAENNKVDCKQNESSELRSDLESSFSNMDAQVDNSTSKTLLNEFSTAQKSTDSMKKDLKMSKELYDQAVKNITSLELQIEQLKQDLTQEVKTSQQELELKLLEQKNEMEK